MAENNNQNCEIVDGVIRQVEQIVSGRLYLNQQIAIKNELQNITRADHDVKNGYSEFYTEKFKIKQLHNNKIVGIEAR